MVSGPVWRLIGTTAVGLLLLTFTPTKWAVQFGAFAGLAGALGAVTAFAFARVGLHSRRNLALYVTALLFVLAWATSGLNGWFYVGNYGVPWFDKQPVIAGSPVTTMFLVLAIAGGLLAGWLHFRIDYAGHTEVADTGRNRVLASTPLLVVATIMVVLEVGSHGQGRREPLPRLHHRQGQPRGAALGVVRRQLRDGRRRARRGRHQCRHAATGPGPALRRSTARWAARTRWASPPTASATPSSPPNPVAANPGTPNSDGPVDKPNIGIGYAAGTGGGYGPEGVNGSRVFLPFGLDPARTPVMGSYDENTARRAEGHLGVVPAAAPHPRPAAGHRRRRRRDLVLRGGRRVQLRPVAEAAVGRAPARRQLPGARRGAADRHLPAEGLAQPAFPAGLGAAGGQRGAHRRRRPEPVRGPVVRVHPAAGAGAADRPGVPRLARRRY